MYKKLAKLQKIHYDAMTLKMNGSSIKEIAKALNKSEPTIKSWFYQDELFREEYSTLQAESIESAKEIIRASAKDAAVRLVELMFQQRGGAVNLAAANSVLDRLGLDKIILEEIGGKTTLDNSLDKLLSQVAEQDKDDGEEEET